MFLGCPAPADSDSSSNERGPVIWEPNPAEWQLILKGSRELHFKDGDFIVMQGKKRKWGIYQITSGTCHIVKATGDDVIKLEEITTGSVFGEISYILATEASGATASILAVSDVKVSFIEGYYLDELFTYYPHIEGSFYGYLSKVLAGRMQLLREDMAT